MANIIKIDNSVLKRHKRNENKKRKENTKELRVYFLIICEGEKTEPNYFRSFKSNVMPFVYTIDAQGEGSNTLDLVNRTIKARDNSSQQYDSVWAVFDKDSFPSANFNSAIKLAEKNNIKTGWTNEAFELWYLLHFQFRNTGMSRADYKKNLEAEVNKAIKERSKAKKVNPFIYEKNSENMYDILEKYGNQAQAIKWAAKLLSNFTCENYATHNPCTKIHLLVEELNGKSVALNKEIEERG
ncbi:RloB family protein [Flavobacterium sp.]|uniref:RloB family protein n=1 Tax=Flavobacterium sp. TaxID=239 RepID=UPI00403419B6